MASETEPDSYSLNGDCDMDEEDTALSPMSSLLVPEIALSDGNDDYDGMNGQNSSSSSQMNGVRLYECDVCLKGFKRKAHLRRHSRLHTGEKPYSCHVCGRTFSRSEQRNQHAAREHNQSGFSCKICAKRFRSEDERMKHMLLHLEDKFFRCDICGKEVQCERELTEHMQLHQTNDSLELGMERSRKTFKCSTCDMEFSRFDHLIRHGTVHSGAKMFQCKFCMKRFTRADNRTKHEKTCRIGKTNSPDDDGETTDDIPIKTEPSDDPLAIINVTSIPEHYFEDIDTSNNDTEDLLDNINLFQEEPDQNITPPAAVEKKPIGTVNPSEYVRMKQSEADRDLKRMGGIRQRVERPKLTKEEIETLTCNICGKTLAQKYHLVRHKVIHLNQKPYKCLKCSRSFARREHLRHHLFTHKRQSEKLTQLQHQHKRDLRSTSSRVAVTKPEITPIRNDSLTGTLRQQLLHRFKLFAIKLKQENMNRESGDFYEHCFNFMGNLILSNIQGVNKEMFSIVSSPSKPTQILKTPIASSSLSAITIKRENDNLFVKKFACNNCDASFPSLRHLERHSVQHTGAKPHICEVCGNRFTRAEHKRRHMAIHTNSQNYECEICLKKFNRSDHMVAHFKVHHHGIAPYKCKFQCGERFDTFKEKLYHSRHCMFVPPAPDSIDKDDEVLQSSGESQEDVPMPEDPFSNGQSGIDDDHQFQSHFIKTENEYPDEKYDQLYDY